MTKKRFKKVKIPKSSSAMILPSIGVRKETTIFHETGMSEEEKKPLQVSDWSQPYKIALYIIGIVGFGAFALYFVWWSLEVLKLLK